MGCTNNGNGTAVPCAASAGAAGPWNDLSTANVGGIACDTTVHVRGVHTTHDSNHGNDSSAGRYFADFVDVNNHACLVSTPIIFQPYSYTTPGTGEVVYLDGTAAPSWTQCTWDGTCDCDAGNQNVTIGAGGQTPCEATWYITGSGSYGKAVGFQKPDGSPAYRVASLAAMTNATANYNAKACTDVGAVDYTWRRCNTDADCPSGSTCAASQSPEVDSFSTEAVGGVAFARWGATPASATHRVYNDDTGIHFLIRGTSAFITVRGFNFRAHARESISFGSASVDNTATDNRILYNCYRVGSGPDYGLAVRQSNRITISSNEIAYSASEGLHCQNLAAGATVYIIQGNWIHDVGDKNVLGPNCHGTPSGMILSDDYQGGDGNYTGTIVEGNLVQRTNTGTSPGRGIIIENDASGVIVRNNVLQDLNDDGIHWDGAVNVNDTQVYNNLVIGSGRGCFYAGGGGNWNGNLIYNNTAVDCDGKAIEEHIAAGSHTNNIIRNNIFYNAGSLAQVDMPNLTGAGGNVFQNNLVYSTTGGTIITFGASTFTCAQTIPSANIDGTAGADSDTCTTPVFVNAGASDYHIQTSSPAKDAGTATGMPSGRTLDINNSLAAIHGLPAYDDADAIQGGVWDIGADEFVAGGAPTRPGAIIISGFRWKLPTPSFSTHQDRP